ncbi:MAG: 16S rRNA (guanine(527)-N(7))-methyltransferase RsmG [Planctomycetota bacterium]|nr:16S rRNA (guanine(527)-N(7))-methyltransferase RsmG [Planctomycetota bacterium]
MTGQMETPGNGSLKTELESMLSNDLVAGLSGREGLVEKLLLHAELTLAANQRLNLTSIVEPRDVALKHFLDSLAPHSLIEAGERVLDLGSGAGYPGIPLACALDLENMILAESTLKKARFLQETADELALPSIEVIGERGEEILRRVKVDTVLARAVGPAERLLKMLERVTRNYGRLLLYKGPDPTAELAKARNIASNLKLREEIVLAYDLPGGIGSRSIVEYRRA